MTQSRDEVPALVERVMSDELPIEAYVTHRMKVGSGRRHVHIYYITQL